MDDVAFEKCVIAICRETIFQHCLAINETTE